MAAIVAAQKGKVVSWLCKTKGKQWSCSCLTYPQQLCDSFHRDRIFLIKSIKCEHKTSSLHFDFESQKS